MKQRKAENLELIGGALCLDFANTFTTDAASIRKDYLLRYEDLVDWSVHAGILPPEEPARLKAFSGRHRAERDLVMEKALSIRETVYALFSSLADHKEVSQDHLSFFNKCMAEIMPRRRIGPRTDGFGWEWHHDSGSMDWMLGPILYSAAGLLTGKNTRKIRQCAAREKCDWLFLDLTKNQSRRWCSMNLCGSRDKVNRYYHRQKQRS